MHISRQDIFSLLIRKTTTQSYYRFLKRTCRLDSINMKNPCRYNDVIMSAMASQITGVSIDYLTDIIKVPRH